jgi:hypothetical protein
MRILVSFADGREHLYVVLGSFSQFENFCALLELYFDLLRIFIRRADDDDDDDDDGYYGNLR